MSGSEFLFVAAGSRWVLTVVSMRDFAAVQITIDTIEKLLPG